MKHPFIRQSEIQRNLVTLMVPQASNPPYQFQYHYVPFDDIVKSLANNDAELSDGIRTFKVKNGVLGVFETLAGQSETGWSFASSNVVDVLAAVRIGEILNVEFDKPFQEVYNILKFHFPSGVANSGYGQYQIHLAADLVRTTGFTIVSSFAGGQDPIRSRLPFFFGFRVFGRKMGESEDPVWRSLLSLSIRYCQEEKWHLSILHAAFSLESIIDMLLKRHMLNSKFHEEYIDHILKVGEKRYELHTLNEIIFDGRLSKKDVNTLSDKLNKVVFTKRNRIAHGTSSIVITRDDVIEAIKETVNFIWEFARDARKDLLITTGSLTFEKMIDAELIESCKTESI